MRILIDILTPKQCMLFSKLSECLEGRGHRVLRTTRRYREVQQLLRLKGVGAIAVGEHGGGDLRDKLRASARRTLELAPVLEEFDPDVAVSFSSPEMARASFGLGVPHLCVNDSPHAEAVARLTVPLSRMLLTPRVIPKGAWTGYGIPPGNIVQYNALDPWAWLREFKPDDRILGELGLDRERPIIVFRPEEALASYLLGRTGEEMTIVPAIAELLRARSGLQVVAVPRYEGQVEALERTLGGRAIICRTAVDGPSLLSRAAVFVGGGGTMSAEAAILGVPTFSCYPGEPYIVERYLVGRGLILRETDPKRLAEGILGMLDDYGEVKGAWLRRSKAMVRSFEDPVGRIAAEIERQRWIRDGPSLGRRA